MMAVRLLIILLLFSGVVDASLRSTWFGVYNYDTNPQETAENIARLAQLGVNAIFIDVWSQGKVYFRSPTMERFIGSQGIGPDHLEWSVNAAHQHGMKVYAWFEYGLIAAYGEPNNPFAKKAQTLGWLSGTANNFVWMNPTNSSVISFLANLICDAAHNYPIDGIQLDDHFAWPSSIRGSSVLAMDQAAKLLFSQVRKCSSITLSLAPATIGFSKESLNVDWLYWAQSGLFDNFVPQLYSSDASSFQQELRGTMAALPHHLLRSLAAGIRVSGASGPTTWNNVKQMIEYTEKQNIWGLSIWYVDGILNTYSTQFKQYWGSQ